MKLSASIRAGSTGLSSKLALALVAIQGIPMTIPQRYGKTETIRQAGLLKEAARTLKISRRENKQHKLKGLRP